MYLLTALSTLFMLASAIGAVLSMETVVGEWPYVWSHWLVHMVGSRIQPCLLVEEAVGCTEIYIRCTEMCIYTGVCVYPGCQFINCFFIGRQIWILTWTLLIFPRNPKSHLWCVFKKTNHSGSFGLSVFCRNSFFCDVFSRTSGLGDETFLTTCIILLLYFSSV